MKRVGVVHVRDNFHITFIIIISDLYPLSNKEGREVKRVGIIHVRDNFHITFIVIISDLYPLSTKEGREVKRVGIIHVRDNFRITFIVIISDLYPLSNIHLAANRTRPPQMPDLAWSASSELHSFHDIAALHTTGPNRYIPDSYQVRRNLMNQFIKKKKKTETRMTASVLKQDPNT